MISDSKLLDYDIDSLVKDTKKINKMISEFEAKQKIDEFENSLYLELSRFNNKNFPSPSFKRKIYNNEINERQYATEKEKEFVDIYNKLVKKYKIALRQEDNDLFLDKWYLKNVREEINYAFNQVKKIKDEKNKRIIAVILSRTIRSCRATTHSDLATLIDPQITTYYCWKHKKICKPLFSIKGWFTRYANDTISRIREFQKIKQHVFWVSITNDSRQVDILKNG
jgi:hypothetical protein